MLWYVLLLSLCVALSIHEGTCIISGGTLTNNEILSNDHKWSELNQTATNMINSVIPILSENVYKPDIADFFKTQPIMHHPYANSVMFQAILVFGNILMYIGRQIGNSIQLLFGEY